MKKKKEKEKLNYHWMLVANRGLLGVTCKDVQGSHGAAKLLISSLAHKLMLAWPFLPGESSNGGWFNKLKVHSEACVHDC